MAVNEPMPLDPNNGAGPTETDEDDVLRGLDLSADGA